MKNTNIPTRILWSIIALMVIFSLKNIKFLSYIGNGGTLLSSYKEYILYLFILCILIPIILSKNTMINLYRRIFSKGSRILLGFSGIFPVVMKLEPGHICLFGSTGSGKSNTVKFILNQISRLTPTLVLDWHGEYYPYVSNFFKVLIPGENFAINPLYKAYGDLTEHIEFLVDLFGDVYKLSEPQKYMLKVALTEAFNKYGEPTIRELLHVIERLPIRSFYDNEIKMALRRRLSSLSEGRAGKAFGGGYDVNVLFEENVLIDLSVFRSIYSRKLFVLILLKLLYDYASHLRPISNKVLHATVIEEAWNIIPYRRLDSQPSIGERIFAELRKFGELIIAVSQFPSETAKSIIKNSRIVVMHRLHGKEIESMGLPSNYNINPLDLRVGEALVLKDGKLRKIYIPKAIEREPYLESTKNKLRFVDRKKRTSAEESDMKELNLRLEALEKHVMKLTESITILEKEVVKIRNNR